MLLKTVFRLIWNVYSIFLLLTSIVYLFECQPQSGGVSSYANCIIFSLLIKEEKNFLLLEQTFRTWDTKEMFKLLQFRPLNYEPFQHPISDRLLRIPLSVKSVTLPWSFSLVFIVHKDFLGTKWNRGRLYGNFLFSYTESTNKEVLPHLPWQLANVQHFARLPLINKPAGRINPKYPSYQPK